MVLRTLIPELPPRAYVLLGASLLLWFGNGLLLPFHLVYLHAMRGIDLVLAGAIAAIPWWLSIIGNPVAGVAIDRGGPKPALTVGVLVAALCSIGFALSTEALQTASSAVALGFATSFVNVGITTILGTIVPRERRSAIFALNYALLNAGLSLGLLSAGFIVDVDRLDTFQLLYVLSAIGYVVFAGVLQLLPVDASAAAPARSTYGFGFLARDPALLRVVVISTLLRGFGVGQLGAGLGLFAVEWLSGGPRVIGYALAANTLVITLLQLPILRLARRARRTRALLLLSVIFAAAWAIAPASTALPALGGVIIALSAVLIGLGETLLAPTIGPIVNDLAPDELRGRYNALAGIGHALGFALSPIIATSLLSFGTPTVLFAGLAAGCLTAGLMALNLESVLAPNANVIA